MRDAIDAKARKASEREQLHLDRVASIALRTIHELPDADQADAAALVTFTGILDTVDPATGQPIRVPVISVRASKAEFLPIPLSKVDSAACLRNLGAQVSASPYQFAQDKPIERVDDGGLLLVLREHARVEARMAWREADAKL